MDERFHFLMQHGYSVLFLFVLVEQAGLPVPSIPILIAAGALAATGSLNLWWLLLLAMSASLASDYGWYQLGRRKGMRVLNFLCRVSLEPDSCVRQTEAAFSKAGSKSLLFAKFIPGLSTAAPPLAGVFEIATPQFLVFDGVGSLLYFGSFLVAGYLFSRQVEMITNRIIDLSGSLVEAGAVGLAIYIGYKFVKRQLFLRELRVLRLAPQDLMRMIEREEPHVIVDLRSPLDFDSEPVSIVGALRMSPDEIEHRHEEIPRDRDVILYCT